MIFTCNIVDWHHSVLGRNHPVSSHIWSNTISLLELTDFHDIAGTFFIASSVAEKYPVLIRKIAIKGHEVAAWLDLPVGHDGFARHVENTIKNLEDIVGSKVIGVRSKELNTTSGIDELNLYCERIRQQGIKYDSSLYSRKPIQLLAENNPAMGVFKQHRIAEYHLPLSSIAGFKQKLFGGASFRQLPYAISLRAGSALHRENTVFHMHSYDLGLAEIAEIEKDYNLSREMKKDFRGRKNMSVKLQHLMRDFPFVSFREGYYFSDEASPYFHPTQMHLG